MVDKSAQAQILPGEQLLQAFHNLLQLVRLYQGNNQLVGNCLRQILEASVPLLKGNDGLNLQLENNRFYINEEKILRRRGPAEYALDHLFTFLIGRRIQGLRLLPNVFAEPAQGLVKLATLLNECAEEQEPAVWVSRHLREAGVTGIEVFGLLAENEAGQREAEKESLESPGHRSPRKVYVYTLRSLRDVAGKISINQRVGMRKVVRMVQIMIEEVVFQEEPFLLAMSTIRSYDDYTYTHSVNVSILALYIGRQLGLAKETLEYLGLCALFHDLGKVMVPKEVLNKVGPLSKREFAEIRQHSLNSTRLIVQLLAAPVARKARIMVPPFEHHLKYDLSGYPDMGWDCPISLCGRILAIADVYDALTSPRIYRREAMSADRALALMLQGSGTAFDPLILKVFIQMLGVFPIGTLLELDSGEVALVSRPPSSADLNRPRALVLHEDGQGGYRSGPEIDLSERDDSEGYRYRIVGSAHPSTRNIQPAQFLA